MILGLWVIVGTAYLGIAAFITAKSYPLFATSGPRPAPIPSAFYAALFGALWPVAGVIGLGRAGYESIRDRLETGVSRTSPQDNTQGGSSEPETPKPQEPRIPGRTWYERILDEEDPWIP